MQPCSVPEKYLNANQWAFGDNPALADELLQLVMSGKKTASCSSLQSYRQDGASSPAIGDYNVILDSAGQPRCVIRTLQLHLLRFDCVTPAQAALEGEGDLSLAYWQQGHQEFFIREGSYQPDMELVYEIFELIEIL